jgi:hypothetical protein
VRCRFGTGSGTAGDTARFSPASVHSNPWVTVHLPAPSTHLLLISILCHVESFAKKITRQLQSPILSATHDHRARGGHHSGRRTGGCNCRPGQAACASTCGGQHVGDGEVTVFEVCKRRLWGSRQGERVVVGAGYGVFEVWGKA